MWKNGALSQASNELSEVVSNIPINMESEARRILILGNAISLDEEITT